MKKVLFASLFAAFAAIGLSSCMNGDYDANPNTSGGTNPLLTQGGTGGTGGGGGSNVGVAAKGEIRCVVNGSGLTITGATYSDIVGRNISGEIQSGTIIKGIGITLNPYSGAATYTLGGSTTNTNFASYNFSDFSAGTTLKNYSTNESGGAGQVVVTSDANNEVIGTFQFEGYYKGEKTTVTSGSFDVPKK